MKRILPPAFARSYSVAGARRAVALSVGGLVSLLLAAISGYSPAATERQRGESDSRFDAAPFGLPLPEGNGVMWEDPREIHEIIVHFSPESFRGSEKIRLEYWGSRWPNQHLPKDRQPGGADVGWMELGNWYRGGWRVATATPPRLGRTSPSHSTPSARKNFPESKTIPQPSVTP